MEILSKQGSYLYVALPGICFLLLEYSTVNLSDLDLGKLITGCLGLIKVFDLAGS